ncbi:MAG: hypothetical protein E7266_02910 [Lachnospiraceae bacterium]|nr:hypothetical protein [Lachnospiraceae bacterium]
MKEKKGIDLSVRENALASMNKTAMIGYFIMNIILLAAYALEVVKKARTPLSYGIFALLCVCPMIIAFVMFMKNKSSNVVRYVFAIGFAVMYAYVMFTSSTDMAFCYVIVIFVLLMVYMDIKILTILGASALLVNIIRVVVKAMNGELVGAALTEAEIIIACLLLTGAYVILALKVINKINKANVEKAEDEKAQSEVLLKTTLEVADNMNICINKAFDETGTLKVAIAGTQKEMIRLTEDAGENVAAISKQNDSTERIHEYVKDVESVVKSITTEVKEAEQYIEANSTVMDDLLHQVNTSETSGNLVVEKMNVLRDCADQMQDIMGLISSIARQTGMLALNASIEAARAGEAGRGFAVVASEISDLSAQTNVATNDINTLIESIVSSVAEVSESMESLLESNRLQSGYIDDTAGNLEKIRSSAEGVVNGVESLKELVDKVTEENKNVEINAESVKVVTDKVVSGADSTLESCLINLASIEKVVEIMEVIKEDATKLQGE